MGTALHEDANLLAAMTDFVLQQHGTATSHARKNSANRVPNVQCARLEPVCPARRSPDDQSGAGIRE